MIKVNNMLADPSAGKSGLVAEFAEEIRKLPKDNCTVAFTPWEIKDMFDKLGPATVTISINPAARYYNEAFAVKSCPSSESLLIIDEAHILIKTGL